MDELNQTEPGNQRNDMIDTDVWIEPNWTRELKKQSDRDEGMNWTELNQGTKEMIW